MYILDLYVPISDILDAAPLKLVVATGLSIPILGDKLKNYLFLSESNPDIFYNLIFPLVYLRFLICLWMYY